MQSRWFSTAVVLLWLGTMTWLVKEKVLPSLLVGEPPSYSKIIEAQRQTPPVGWRVSFNNRPIGWALTDTKLQSSGLTEIHGRVHFDTLPLQEMMPGWLRSLSRLIEHPADKLQMDARSVLTIDALGHLVRFNSKVRVDPLNEVICVRGTVEGRKLELLVRTGPASFSSEAMLPSDALLSDALSPQTQLPGLRIGQKWTVPVYSPLWPAKYPLEIIHATVEDMEPVFWNGAMEDAWLVVYRNDPSSGTAEGQAPRGKLWVHRNGTVLRQQVLLFDSTITFVRMPDDEAVELAESAGEEWWSTENEQRGDIHD